MTTPIRVLVYGANGTQGRPVVKRLLDSGYHVRGITRQADQAESLRRLGIEVAVANLTDPESIQAATNEMDAVYLVLPLEYDLARAVGYGRTAIDAAKKSAVKQLVFNTSTRLPGTATDVPAFEIKREIEAYLARSGVPSTVLRPTFYYENLAGPWSAPAIVRDHVIASPIPASFQAAWITASDVAACAVEALQRKDAIGRAFDLGGPDHVDSRTLIQAFAEQLKCDFSYYAIPPSQFATQLNEALGEPAGTEIAKLYRWLEANHETSVFSRNADAQTFFRAPLTRIQDWIAAQNWKQLAEG